MQGSRSFRRFMRCTLALVALAVAQSVSAQTTQFTYQGKLVDSGAPTNGAFDFQIKLFDALSGGAQQGSTATLTGVAVTSGIFTLKLDFGACSTCFSGAARYLEIAVKPAGGSTYLTLSPRQQVTSTPYAIKSLNAAAADGLSVACVSCVTSTQIASVNGSAVSGAIPVASVPPGSGNYIQNSTSPQAASNFNISGNGTAGGTLSANVVNATAQYNLDGARVVGISGVSSLANSNTFVGIGAGVATTPDTTGNGSSNSFFGNTAGLNNTTGFGNSFFGMSTGQANTTGSNNSFYGLNAGVNNQTGGSNAFFGQNAGAANTSGALNSFFGAGAGFSNTAGGSNAFFGKNAGAFNTAGGGNTFIGSGADFNSNNPTGDNNTLLGNLTRVNSGFSNATAVGAFARVTQSNSLVLGAINGVNGANADTSVGIGTTAPAARLQVVTDDDHNPGVIAAWDGRHFVIGRTSSIGGIGMSFSQATGVGFIEALIPNVAWGDLVMQSGGGRVGIGTASPLDTLDVNGGIRTGLRSGGNIQLCLNPTSQISTCSSSLRYKSNLAPFRSGLRLIRGLSPITFNWKNGGGLDLGLAAEEVAKVEPLLVTHNDKGEVEGVKYDRISVVLINAVREQQAQIEHDRQQLASQQRHIEALLRWVCRRSPKSAICQPAKPARR